MSCMGALETGLHAGSRNYGTDYGSVWSAMFAKTGACLRMDGGGRLQLLADALAALALVVEARVRELGECT